MFFRLIGNLPADNSPETDPVFWIVCSQVAVGSSDSCGYGLPYVDVRGAAEFVDRFYLSAEEGENPHRILDK